MFRHKLDSVLCTLLLSVGDRGSSDLAPGHQSCFGAHCEVPGWLAAAFRHLEAGKCWILDQNCTENVLRQ